MSVVNPDIEKYVLEHIDPEPELLHRLNRDTHRRCLYPDMCSGHYQGRFLKMLVRMIKPRRILELGTFTGYSAMCMAEGSTDDAQVHTVEVNDEMARLIQRNFDSWPYGKKIKLHVGDALRLIEPLSREYGPWDIVFLDANKRNYADYYDLVLPHVATGGFIVADNTLWYGKVGLADKPHDAQTRGILRFNDIVANDKRVEKVILPLRDGLSLIHKL
ncbi:MAG: O-methyltransferase [Muribaculum sp.]|nr:O-methyltransferase [Muribaculaceae bacterium]MCM1080144.1 O-methyltransferase [Muribaculum sp.]